jgi:phage terminase large subunit
MKTTNVFSRNIKAYNQYSGTGTIIVDQGGQGSGKTFSILQLLYLIARYKKKHITIASYALPHLKGGAMKDFDLILTNEGIFPDSVCNRSEQIYYIGQSQIHFVGIEGNEAKATGPRRDILYVNEANKRIKYDVFELMNARTADCTFIDFNPSKEFWFHEKVMPNFKYHLIKSTYLDNDYLPERERDNIVSKKDKPGFENWWKVYGLGELGQLDDAILKNWTFGEFNDSLPYGYGLDFGVKHPDAMVKAAVDRANMKLYWKEEIYKSNNSTDRLVELLNARNVGKKLIVADSAGTRNILDLSSKGFNIVGVQKNRVVEDIKMLQNYEIIVDPESYNLESNLNNWIWLDKKGEIPIDVDDDLIDAGRYYTAHMVKPFKNPKSLRIVRS